MVFDRKSAESTPVRSTLTIGERSLSQQKLEHKAMTSPKRNTTDVLGSPKRTGDAYPIPKRRMSTLQPGTPIIVDTTFENIIAQVTQPNPHGRVPLQISSQLRWCIVELYVFET